MDDDILHEKEKLQGLSAAKGIQEQSKQNEGLAQQLDKLIGKFNRG